MPAPTRKRGRPRRLSRMRRASLQRRISRTRRSWTIFSQRIRTPRPSTGQAAMRSLSAVDNSSRLEKEEMRIVGFDATGEEKEALEEGLVDGPDRSESVRDGVRHGSGLLPGPCWRSATRRRSAQATPGSMQTTWKTRLWPRCSIRKICFNFPASAGRR